MGTWVERELAGGEFPDTRLKTRLGHLLGDLGARIGHTPPAACQDWAATKAAYRFFGAPRVDDQTILGGHFAATADRFAATAGTVLVLHDTTEFSFTRPTADAVGVLSYVNGRHRTHTTCGALLHSSLAVTTDRLPLALAAVTFWPRQRFTGTNAAKRTVHLVRTAVDRLAGQGTTTVARLMRREPVRGTHAVEVRDEPGTVSTATVAVRVRRLTVRPPPANRKGYGPLVLTVISAIERGRPAGREPIRWKSLTDRPVADLASAVEKLDWYAVRWKTCWRWCAWSGGGVLADHDQPGGPRRPARGGVHPDRDRRPGSSERPPIGRLRPDGRPRPAGGGQAGRLPGPHGRPAAGEHGRVAWPHPPRRPAQRLRTERAACG
jgi:hypothetical protein